MLEYPMYAAKSIQGVKSNQGTPYISIVLKYS
jgi:hypothetical protein